MEILYRGAGNWDIESLKLGGAPNAGSALEIRNAGAANFKLEGALSLEGGFSSGLVLTVDSQGLNGDFQTIKKACDFAAANTPPKDPLGVFEGFPDDFRTAGQTPSWWILCFPGKYPEKAFTIPALTKLTGLVMFDARSSIQTFGNRPFIGAQVHFGQDETAGSMITIEESGGMSNMDVFGDFALRVPPSGDYDGTATGDIVMIDVAGGFGPLFSFSHQELTNVSVSAVVSTAAFGMKLVRVASTDGQAKGCLIDRCRFGLGGSAVALGASGIGIDILDTSGLNGRPVTIRDTTVFVEGPASADLGIRADDYQVLLTGDNRIEGFTTPLTTLNAASFTNGLPIPATPASPGHLGQVARDVANGLLYWHNGTVWEEATLTFGAF